MPIENVESRRRPCCAERDERLPGREDLEGWSSTGTSISIEIYDLLLPLCRATGLRELLESLRLLPLNGYREPVVQRKGESGELAPMPGRGSP